MTDQIYLQALQNIERRLSNPRDLSLHTIVFSAITTIAALSNIVTYRYVVEGTYIGVYLWCLALAAHGFYHYRRSGLSKSAREKAIQNELLRIGSMYDLSVEELVDLHTRLDEDVKLRATPLRWTIAAITGYQALWQGVLAFLLFTGTFFSGYYLYFSGFMQAVQYAPFVGTTILGFVLAVAMFLNRRTAEDHEVQAAYLRALYNTKLEKSKRIATERLMVDDEGEIIVERVIQHKRG